MRLSRLRNAAHSSTVAPVNWLRVLGSWARQILSAADRQGPEQQQSLIVFGQSAYVVGQEFNRAGVLVQLFSGSSGAW